jgi:hypothetical protein
VPAVIEYTLNRFEEELAKALHGRSQKDGELRRQAAEIERSIANLLCGLSDGYSPAITAEIVRGEKRLAEVQERLRTAEPPIFKLKMRDTRQFVESRLRDLSGLLEREARIAREEIAKHVRKITLRPAFRSYVATGIWDWLGVLGSAATMVVPGARIELATPAFSGRRSTSELPRHG